jgi:hypothetical protein
MTEQWNEETEFLGVENVNTDLSNPDIDDDYELDVNENLESEPEPNYKVVAETDVDLSRVERNDG